MLTKKLCLIILGVVVVSLVENNVSGHHVGLESFSDIHREIFNRELKKIDFYEVKKDIIELLHSSQEFHPSDYHHYGPFFIRMAWHCAGTYRESDGEGGCDGARQRFEPEATWEDNANLAKARKLLWPIKQKYGIGLSWGDLMILTGTVAIEDMKGPVLGFCAGRRDDFDNADSLMLGPSELQEKFDDCRKRGEDGDCKEPLGQNTVGLIYVNPEGFMGKPDPKKSAEPTREVFGRMGMNDTETAGLIAGGHSFGKAHGDPKGVDTSHIEGPWTPTPLEFNLDFVRLLLENDFSKYKGPGGRYQWKPKTKLLDKILHFHGKKEEDQKTVSHEAPSADLKGKQQIMMMTTDVAMLEDKEYTKILHQFLDDPSYFSHVFKHAWYKLVTRDMGPVSRCAGPMVAPVQAFQSPLPNEFKKMPALSSVEQDVVELFTREHFDPALFTELAYLCSSTFRNTDFNGGCNGARIRLSPENEWPDRAGMDEVISKLMPLKAKYTTATSGISISDLIVLSGTVALRMHMKSMNEIKFCPGRVDAETAPNSAKLKLWKFDDKAFEFKRQAKLMGLSSAELVSLYGRPRSAEYMNLMGYSGTYSETSSFFGNTYFKALLFENWTKVERTGHLPLGAEYTNLDGSKFMTEKDLVIVNDSELQMAAFELATSEELFERVFWAAWWRLMNADRFDGPVENLCENGNAEIHVLKMNQAGLISLTDEAEMNEILDESVVKQNRNSWQRKLLGKMKRLFQKAEL